MFLNNFSCPCNLNTYEFCHGIKTKVDLKYNVGNYADPLWERGQVKSVQMRCNDSCLVSHVIQTPQIMQFY